MTKKVLTYNGDYQDLDQFNIHKVSIEEIAHTLSNLCRYNGATHEFYSIAEHSLHMTQAYFNEGGKNHKIAAAILLHDASEAYVGDVPYHVKKTMPEFQELEDRIDRAIHTKYELYMYKDEQVIKDLDRRICIDEMYWLLDRIDPMIFEQGYDKPLGIHLFETKSPSTAYQEFMEMAKYLGLEG